MALRILAGHAKKQVRGRFRRHADPRIAPEKDLTCFMNPRIREQAAADCWATAAVECVEALYFKEKGVRVELSVQHVVDRAPRKPRGPKPKVELSFEKEGGYINDAFDFITEHGVALERDWPYNQPPINEHGPKIRINDYLFAHGRQAMLRFLNTTNTPLVARLSVDASLFDYEKGVLGYINTLQNCDTCQDKDCELHTKDVKYHCKRCGYGFGFHFANICGYGPGYWKVRNSWGCGWGVDGYFKVLKRLARNEKAPRALLGRKHPIFPYHPPHGVFDIEAGAIQPIGPISIMRN